MSGLLGFLALCSMDAAAQTLGITPLMGQLVDGNGVPVTGVHEVEVALFDAAAGGGAWWSDSFDVQFAHGSFAVALGDGEQDLDLDAFGDHPELWVALSVDGGAFTDRTRIGRSPLAAHAVRATRADAVGALEADQVASLSDLNSTETTLAGQIAALAASVASDLGSLAATVGSDLQSATDALSASLAAHDTRLIEVEDRAAVLESNLAVGMIAFFPGTCPLGWAEYAPLRGRVPVGRPLGGVAEATVGSALGNQAQVTITQVPAHAHLADPPATASGTESAGHTHSVDPPATASGTESAGHSHSVDPPNTGTSTNGNHSHSFNQGVSTGEDDDNMISGWNNFSNGDVPRHDWVPSLAAAGDHSHSMDIGAFNSSGASAAHTHTTDIGSFASAGASAAHTHTTDIASFSTSTTGAAGVDVTMPYVQLVACQLQPQ
jgi:hypothetical protein